MKNAGIYTPEYRATDFRTHPERYRIGRGEQGVLIVEPYKSELLPLWRFATPEAARESSEALFARFLAYRDAGEFVGMDMARKFLQMGWTRARRYANHRSGKKYDGPVPQAHRGQSGAWGRETRPLDPDPVKAEAAEIFYDRYIAARDDPEYQRLRRLHENASGASALP